MSLSNGERLFRVEASPAVLERLAERHAEIGDPVAGAQFIFAVRSIYGMLRRSARSFGEPLQDLKALDLQIRVGAIAPASVTYAVHKSRPLVFVRDFFLLYSK
jgi:hypothetical protein